MKLDLLYRTSFRLYPLGFPAVVAMRRMSPAVCEAPSCALWLCSGSIGVFLQASLSALLQQLSAVSDSRGLCVAGEIELKGQSVYAKSESIGGTNFTWSWCLA